MERLLSPESGDPTDGDAAAILNFSHRLASKENLNSTPVENNGGSSRLPSSRQLDTTTGASPMAASTAAATAQPARNGEAASMMLKQREESVPLPARAASKVSRINTENVHKN